MEQKKPQTTNQLNLGTKKKYVEYLEILVLLVCKVCVSVHKQ